MSAEVAGGAADALQPLSSRDTRLPMANSSVRKLGHSPISTDAGALDVFSTLKVRSSEQFGKVMHDLQVRRQEQLRRIEEQLRTERERQGADVQISLQELRDLIPEEEDEDEEENSTKGGGSEPVLTPLQQTARRAWGHIRRYIQEQAMKNRNQKSKLQWSMLKQTLSHMNNMEQARADLYDRYLNRPESWTDGLTQIPENLFKKTKSGRYAYFANANATDYVSPRAHKPKGSDMEESLPAKKSTTNSKSQTRDKRVSDKGAKGREKDKREKKRTKK